MRKLIAITVVTASCFIGVSHANAQPFLTPFAGVTFGQDAPDQQLTYGAGLTFMGKAAGFEVEFSNTPDFFNQNTNVVLIADSNLMTFMGNLVLGPGVGPVRPYVVAGAGLMRMRVDNPFVAVNSNDWGVDAGGGVIAKVGEHAGIRGDLRYFRNLQDPSNDNDLDIELGRFGYWRATAGIALGF